LTATGPGRIEASENAIEHVFVAHHPRRATTSRSTTEIIAMNPPKLVQAI